MPADGSVVDRGTIGRLVLDIRSGMPRVVSEPIIGSGFAERTDPAALVVGPTGVFVLDTKAWRGVVTSDGKGELLLNGQPTDKPYIRQFVGG